ncbi:hypothetical protein ANO14919_089060 [Xylariales sp. No.14919]|nr:hypothetical protein ANO14919_089060 [Xylariales sp. No.14919]
MAGFFQYAFWQCGHITRTDDGTRVSSDGDLSQPPLRYFCRDRIRRSFGDLCPSCYTSRIMVRLRDIRILLYKCNSKNEAVIMAEGRVMALTKFLAHHPGEKFLTNDNNFVNYPPEFLVMAAQTIDLEAEVLEASIEDITAAQKRFRSRVSMKFRDAIQNIRENALMCFSDGNDTMKQCLAQILKETDEMVREVEMHDDEELGLLADLHFKAEGLQKLLDEYRAQRKAHIESLKNPEF